MKKWLTVQNKQRLKILSYFIIALIFYLLIRSLYQNRGKVDWSKLDFNILYLLLSLVFVFLSYMVSIYSWKLMLAEMGEKIGYFQALRIVGKSQLGKYLPGGVWMTASRVYLAEQEGLSKSKVLLSSLVEQEYVFVTALVLSILFLGFRGSILHINLAAFNIGFLLAALLLVNPISLNLFLKWGMKFLRPDQKDYRFSLSLYLILVASYSLCWLLQGAGFFFLVKSFYPVELALLKRFVGVFLLSWLIGFVAIFAPGGLGIREGSMTLLLQSMFPTGLAVTISLVSRIWISLAELLLAGLAVVRKVRT